MITIEQYINIPFPGSSLRVTSTLKSLQVKSGPSFIVFSMSELEPMLLLFCVKSGKELIIVSSAYVLDGSGDPLG